MTKDWVHGVGHCAVCRSYCSLLWERWLHPLHQLGPVLMGCCRLQLTYLSSVILPQPPLLCEGWGGHPLCLSGDSTVLALWLQLSAVFCPSVQYLSLFCEEFSWTILDSRFPLFYSGQVFHQLVCPLTVVLPQIFFNLTTVISYPVFFSLFSCTSWCCCSLPCISLILQAEIVSFSVFFFCCTDKNFCSDPGFFSFGDVCQGSHWLFQSLLCWRWWSLNLCLHFRCLWRWEVQTSCLLQLGRFSTHWDLSAFRDQTWVLCFLACWFFQAKLEGHHQVVITSSVCSWKTLCSGTVHSWSEVIPH